MAARRLIIVMLVLLGISTALAVVTPAPRERDTQEEQSGPTGSTGPTDVDGEASAGPDAELVEATVVSDEGSQIIAARPGDRVVLSVQPAIPADVEIRKLGLIATAAEGSPAVFDFIMPAEPEGLVVTQFGNNRQLALVSSAKHDLEQADRQAKSAKNEKEAGKPPRKQPAA